MVLIIDKIDLSQSTIVKGDIEKYNSKTYDSKRKEKWNEHRIANRTRRSVVLPGGKISIPSNYCKYFSERYAEFVCSDPIQDVIEGDLWQGSKKRYPFHSSYLPLEISKTSKSDALTSTTALENVGAIVLGYLIECSNPPHNPIARPVQKSPDLISLSNRGLFFFHEAKASKSQKAIKDKIPDLVGDGIRELLAGVCDAYRIISSWITNYNPLTVEVAITEMREQTSGIKDFLTILQALETVIETEGMTRKVSSGQILEEIFGIELSKKIQEANPDFLEDIDKEIASKIKDLEKDKIIKPILKRQVDLTSNSFNETLDLPRVDIDD